MAMANLEASYRDQNPSNGTTSGSFPSHLTTSPFSFFYCIYFNFAPFGSNCALFSSSETLEPEKIKRNMISISRFLLLVFLINEKREAIRFQNPVLFHYLPFGSWENWRNEKKKIFKSQELRFTDLPSNLLGCSISEEPNGDLLLFYSVPIFCRISHLNMFNHLKIAKIVYKIFRTFFQILIIIFYMIS